MLPSHSDLTYFYEVAKTNNLSRAAERLGISQPALSLSIKRLEHAIGQPVLIRSKSGIRLTRTGLKMLAQTRDLLDCWHKIKSESLKDSEQLFGTYSLGCHPSVAMYTLPYFLSELFITHPNLEINLSHGLSRYITEDVISFKLDFGIVVNPTPHPDLVIKKLLLDTVQFWTKTKPSPLQTIANEIEVLICDPALIQTQSLLQAMKSKKITFKRIVTSSNLEVITTLTAAGVGIGIIPTRVANHISTLPLKPLPNSPQFNDTICLVYRKDVQSSIASQTLAKQIQTFLKTNTSINTGIRSKKTC